MLTRKLPAVDELVMVKITEVDDVTARGVLVEYDQLEGMIQLSDLSRKRIRSVNKLIRVGALEVVAVIRVDAVKGFIDLGKKNLREDEVERFRDTYAKNRAVASILRHVADSMHFALGELERQVAIPLRQEFPHTYDGLRSLSGVNDTRIVGLPGDVREKLIVVVRHRIADQPYRIRADINVTCYRGGIDPIQSSLIAGKVYMRNVVDESAILRGTTFNIILDSSPKYVVYCVTHNRAAGIELIDGAVKHIAETIAGMGGEVEVRSAARVVSEDVADTIEKPPTRDYSSSDDCGDSESDDSDEYN